MVGGATVVAMTGTARSGSYRWGERTLAYESWGDGDAVVVLLHGLLLDRTMYRGLARHLADAGHRVVLPDLLGHGQSDKPAHASEYRMDVYADQVVALLDELGVERAVLGGASLGANVSLLLAAAHPGRVRALVLEMPVLEWAVPAAAMAFVPLLLGVHYAAPVVRLVSRVTPRRTGVDLLDSVFAPLRLPPEAAAAILHGILVGPVAPTMDARRSISVPALLVAHGRDLIHPFSDAENLAAVLPRAELVRARSPLELRLRPGRLTAVIERFLAEHPQRPRITRSRRTSAPRDRRTRRSPAPGAPSTSG